MESKASILKVAPIQSVVGTCIPHSVHTLHFDHMNSVDKKIGSCHQPMDPERYHFATRTSYCTAYKTSTAAVSPSAG